MGRTVRVGKTWYMYARRQQAVQDDTTFPISLRSCGVVACTARPPAHGSGLFPSRRGP